VSPAELISVAERAIKVFEQLSDELGLGRAWRLIAGAHDLARRAGPSAEASEQALVHIRRAGDPLEEADSVEYLALALMVGPAPVPEAIRRCEALLEEVASKPALELMVTGFLANLLAMAGRLAEARELMEQGHRLRDERVGRLWFFPHEFGLQTRSAEPPRLQAFWKHGASAAVRVRPPVPVLRERRDLRDAGTVQTPSPCPRGGIMSVPREGGCACGAVRYRLTSDPLFTHCCHCLNCQRQTGSAFVINLLIEADRVELLAGVPQPIDVPRDDGSKQRIFRCPTCQVAVFSEYGRPEVRFVRGGTLDQPSGVTPDVHIFTRSKVTWVTLPDSVPAFEVYYDMKALWPAASLERLEAILAPADPGG
jgi:hypothetical protein